MLKAKKKVRPLLRVSSDQQLEADGDLSIQRKLVLECIKKQPDWELDSKEYFEGSNSGYKNSVAERDILQQALTDAQNKEYDILVIYKDDRLGRRMLEVPFYIMTLSSFGVDVYSVKDGLLTPREKDIPALGHVVVKDMAVAATCTVQGKTEGSHCSICGKVFVPQRNISITAHSWDTWKVIKAATTSKEGEQRRVCNKCGKIESKKIAKLSSVPQTLIIKRGKTATLKPSSTWKNIKYSSSNKKVATVDKKGKIKAIAAGTVKITVKSGSKKAVCTVTIPGTTAIKGVKSLIAVKKGKSCILKPKLNYVGTADAITYKTSNKKIATVSKTGTIKGRKKGTVIITIKSGKVTKTCKVKVK